MRHVSSIQGVCMLGALALVSLGGAGCLKDVGLGPGAGEGQSTGSGPVSGGTGGCGPLSTGPGEMFNNCTGAEVSTGTGMVGGVGGSASGGMTTGVGGGSFGSSTSGGMTTGVGGGSFGSSTSGGMSTGAGSFGVGGSAGGMSSAVSSGSGSSGSSTGSSSGSTAACQLGPEPIPCDFSHLNADCAPYGAVCDYVFSQCSCCFVHDDLSCAQDADCQSSFGADAYCSSGKCGCK